MEADCEEELPEAVVADWEELPDDFVEVDCEE